MLPPREVMEVAVLYCEHASCERGLCERCPKLWGKKKKTKKKLFFFSAAWGLFLAPRGAQQQEGSDHNLNGTTSIDFKRILINS